MTMRIAWPSPQEDVAVSAMLNRALSPQGQALKELAGRHALLFSPLFSAGYNAMLGNWRGVAGDLAEAAVDAWTLIDVSHGLVSFGGGILKAVAALRAGLGEGVFAAGGLLGMMTRSAKRLKAAENAARMDALIEDLAELDAHDRPFYSAPHGNSLESLAPAQGYILEDRLTLEPLKYGMTTLGKARYTEAELAAMNAQMNFVADGSVAEMRQWETKQILDYFAGRGELPPYNSSSH